MLPQRLREIRTARGLTLTDLCKLTGIPFRTYQNYEGGMRDISVKALVKLADFYGVTTDYLLGREVDPIKAIISSLSESDKAIIANYSALSGKTRDDFIQTINRIFAGVAPDVPQIPDIAEICEMSCGELESAKKDVPKSG